jgi:hypothetical protein
MCLGAATYQHTDLNPIRRVGLVQSGHHLHLIEIVPLFSPWHSWKISHSALSNNHSLISFVTLLKLKRMIEVKQCWQHWNETNSHTRGTSILFLKLFTTRLNHSYFSIKIWFYFFFLEREITLSISNVNEHEILLNITFRHKLKQRNSTLLLFWILVTVGSSTMRKTHTLK